MNYLRSSNGVFMVFAPQSITWRSILVLRISTLLLRFDFSPIFFYQCSTLLTYNLGPHTKVHILIGNSLGYKNGIGCQIFVYTCQKRVYRGGDRLQSIPNHWQLLQVGGLVPSFCRKMLLATVNSPEVHSLVRVFLCILTEDTVFFSLFIYKFE